jgi:hypothetical protein
MNYIIATLRGAGLLASIVEEHTRKTGKVPWTIAADVGFGSAG